MTREELKQIAIGGWAVWAMVTLAFVLSVLQNSNLLNDLQKEKQTSLGLKLCDGNKPYSLTDLEGGPDFVVRCKEGDELKVVRR